MYSDALEEYFHNNHILGRYEIICICIKSAWDRVMGIRNCNSADSIGKITSVIAANVCNEMF